MIVCVWREYSAQSFGSWPLSFHSHPTAHTFLGDYLTASAPQSVGYAEADQLQSSFLLTAGLILVNDL